MVNNYKYDEWGNILESNQNISNPFRYAGEVYDGETGLYYLRARYYDPAVGRFINEDSFEGQVDNPLSMNLYSYCYNNPLIYTDPTGNTVQDFFTGMANALDDNLTGGFCKWPVNKLLDVNHDYTYDDASDYYLGRVVGDVFSMGMGIGSLIGGVKTIIASVAAGGALSVGSGGVLTVGGVSIAVAGVAVGAAEVTYGGAVIAASAGNLGNDLNKLMSQRGVGGKGWRGDKSWKSNVQTVKDGGTIDSFNGQIPTEKEAIDLITESGGKVNRIEGPMHLQILITIIISIIQLQLGKRVQ